MTNISSLEVLAAARIVADYAYSQGVERATISHRLSYSHLGAVLADSILQAGVNYNFVVRPRVERILKLYPNASCGDGLFFIIDSGTSSEFLCWSHNEKVVRFEKVVSLLRTGGITSADELANRLKQNGFRDELHALRGIGPKTIDYMSCLVGIDCVAVDRHVREFARDAGIETDGYEYLKKVFSYAADLLSIARRDFDNWIWKRQASRIGCQFSLEF